MKVNSELVTWTAERFIGVAELPGEDDNPMVLSMLKLDNSWPENDEVPWCSAYVNYIAWLLRLPRSKSLRARSWLTVGRQVTQLPGQKPWCGATRGDVVILQRGAGEQPGPEVIEAPGHVGFFFDWENGKVRLLGGNQGNRVDIRPFDADRILGIRRLTT